MMGSIPATLSLSQNQSISATVSYSLLSSQGDLSLRLYDSPDAGSRNLLGASDFVRVKAGGDPVALTIPHDNIAIYTTQEAQRYLIATI